MQEFELEITNAPSNLDFSDLHNLGKLQVQDKRRNPDLSVQENKKTKIKIKTCKGEEKLGKIVSYLESLGC